MANKLEMEPETLPPTEQFSLQGNSSNGPGPAQLPQQLTSPSYPPYLSLLVCS